MGRLIVVTGGARSGKSTFAEKLAKDSKDEVIYIATSIPFDDEMKIRIKKHVEQRPKEWKTIEAYRDIDQQLENEKNENIVFLLDCVTIMITNIMLEIQVDWDNARDEEMEKVEEVVKLQINKILKTAEKKDAVFIMVTNEVGMGIVPENRLTRVFRDIAGRMNQILAGAADEVYLCVSGIPVKIK
ncbi:MAG: Bifunctional adenosylcobalamin biosynthesis protein CobU [Firmicutes bacterium ADurb.Bin419]|nr:MAG: Bifunctional adenosylcobalamin biosynthesis protein CobU [Firmicutes bacterium ADurb.Bin419]